MLRPAGITFKGYADWVGMFPEETPRAFVEWLREQISCELPLDRLDAWPARFATLEALLVSLERTYQDLGLEIVTSSGTSGRMSFVPRDREGLELAMRAFFTAIQATWGVQRGTGMLFMMPAETRVAMARVARMGTRVLGWDQDGPVHFAIPFPATPDRIRIRSGRSFKGSLTGWSERHIQNPFMAWADDHLAVPRILANTRAALQSMQSSNRPIFLLGSLSHLHQFALQANHGEAVALPPGSRVASGGGMKVGYDKTQAEIREDLKTLFAGTAVSDVYGMAEANWAAFECPYGNYHIPPWVYAVVTDSSDRILRASQAEGLLAFFDPLGGGGLYPPFFQTSDWVQLCGSPVFDPALACPCGEQTAYIHGAIQRVDLVEEAGCAGVLA